MRDVGNLTQKEFPQLLDVSVDSASSSTEVSSFDKVLVTPKDIAACVLRRCTTDYFRASPGQIC
jgi:hypothetical protein